MGHNKRARLTIKAAASDNQQVADFKRVLKKPDPLSIDAIMGVIKEKCINLIGRFVRSLIAANLNFSWVYPSPIIFP